MQSSKPGDQSEQANNLTRGRRAIQNPERGRQGQNRQVRQIHKVRMRDSLAKYTRQSVGEQRVLGRHIYIYTYTAEEMSGRNQVRGRR